MNKLIAVVGSGLLVLGLGACTGQPQKVVETVTVAPDPVPATPNIPSTEFMALEAAWSTVTRSQQATMCAGFRIDPTAAWLAFDEGAEGTIARESFMTFFTMKCGSPV